MNTHAPENCQHHGECGPDKPEPVPWQRGPAAAQQWIAELDEASQRLIQMAASQRFSRGLCVDLLGQNLWMRAKAWTAAWGDTEQVRAEGAILRQQAALLFSVLGIEQDLGWGRTERFPRYPGWELVEPHLGPELDRMYGLPGEADRVAMLPELRRVVAEIEKMGEQVAGILDPVLPAAVR